MTDGRLRLAIAAVAVAGIGITSYLVYHRYSGTPLACTIGGGCETVQKSQYAVFLGVPVAVIGLAGYVALLAATLAPGALAATALAAMATVGWAFAMWLLAAQVFLIEAICQWCVASDALITVILLLAGVRLWRLGVTPRGFAAGTLRGARTSS